MPQTERFDNVYVGPRVRAALHSILDTTQAARFWSLVNKLQRGMFDVPGLRVEKLKTSSGKVYSARINVEMRVIFSMYVNKSTGKRSIVFWDANHHDDAYNRLERSSIPVAFQPSSNFLEVEETWSASATTAADFSKEQPDEEDITNGMLLFRVPHYVLSTPERYRAFEKSADRYLRLSEEQEELLAQKDRAHLIRGAAGTGKTSLALFYALELNERRPDDNVYFFTYHDELACVCSSYRDNLLSESAESEDAGEFRVFSYLQFCKHYLSNHPQVKKQKWTWIDQATALKHLTDIINSRTKWARSLDPAALYKFIYSILKGRFVPGTDRLATSAEDFRRVLKGYGNLPAKLEDILEVFGHYEERLAVAKQKDEADLISICYHEFKNRGTTSADRPTWIIIDEIQDFTELEWKSILLFWENQCLQKNSNISFPFLCGDTNQNISNSGFRWQDVDSYVQNTLRTMHRPSAVQTTQLHRNFRNSRQIFELSHFIRALAPHATGDLGLPPELDGRKPQLVIGQASDFNNFLSSLDEPYDESMPAPMVVLFENSIEAHQAKNIVEHDQNLFLMPMMMSKGLEFEDAILYRPFSSLPTTGVEEISDNAARVFDLWYMGVTRARQNLLLFMTAEDHASFKQLLGPRYEAFQSLVETHTEDPATQLRRFYENRERYLPNYAIVFLERVKAQEIWQQFQSEPDKTSSKAQTLKNHALKLWKRCRDITSLGKALMEFGEFEAALTYLRQSEETKLVASCLESLLRFEEAAETFLTAGQPLDAARCFHRAQKFPRAANLFEEQEQWSEAASNWRLAGETIKAARASERAQHWQLAAELYEEKSEWLKSAQLYQQCSNFAKAANLYLRGKNKLDAAHCYVLCGRPELAAPLFESTSHFAEAAECYESLMEFNKAGALYSKAGRLKDVARCKESAGDIGSAANAYERMRQWDKAAQAYLSLQQLEKAAQSYEKGEHWSEALAIWQQLDNAESTARCLDRLERFEEAGDQFARANRHNESGHCYEKIEKFADAAEQYLKGNNHSAAASMLARIGRKIDAARLYVLSNQASVAAELFAAGSPNDEKLLQELVEWTEQNQSSDMAAALHDATGNYDEAIRLYRTAMKLTKAAESAERAKKFELAAQLYLQDGKIDRAALNFYTANKVSEAAKCYEMLKRWHDARRLYEQIGDQDGIRRCESAANWF